MKTTFKITFWFYCAAYQKKSFRTKNEGLIFFKFNRCLKENPIIVFEYVRRLL